MLISKGHESTFLVFFDHVDLYLLILKIKKKINFKEIITC